MRNLRRGALFPHCIYSGLVPGSGEVYKSSFSKYSSVHYRVFPATNTKKVRKTAENLKSTRKTSF